MDSVNGEYSMLIDINGDGLLDRVFDRNPKNEQPGLYAFSLEQYKDKIDYIECG
jgi:hypothetical protein